ncbi:MAG: hypothetical protein ABF240_07705 [Flavobacteriales bacterium]
MHKLNVSFDKNVLVSYDSLHQDSVNLFREVKRINSVLKSKGFISSYESIVELDSNSYQCNFVLGDLYEWEKLRFSAFLSELLTTEPRLGNLPITEQYIKESMEEILIACENKGYPFAEVFFDSTAIKEGRISSIMKVNTKSIVKIDSIIVKGGLRTSLNYVTKQIGIEKGDVYNQRLINDVDRKISNIPFVETIRSPEVYFTKGKATLVLYLKDNAASRFDGIIGLNPDETTGRIGFVGDLKINLLNTFKRGENIVLNWEQAKTQTQNYLVRFDYPFLLRTRLGMASRLNYFRQDTSFANLDASFGLSFFLDERQQVGLSVQVVESNSLLESENNTQSIPSTNSLQTLYYGVNYSYNSLDYLLNPRRGLQIAAKLQSGSKTVQKDGNNESFDYESLQEKTTQVKTDVSISYFIPIWKKATVLTRIQSGNIFGDNLFVNELYQIGGLKTLRGFNQQSIFASNYAIGTAEFRYLFERNSAIFAYFDYGFYENKSINDFATDTPFGFGVGTNFQTKAGIFSLTYGLGQQKGNPLLIRNGKVHFGFVSLF